MLIQLSFPSMNTLLQCMRILHLGCWNLDVLEKSKRGAGSQRELFCNVPASLQQASECATARQHKVAEVACYRLERSLMGCADPTSKGVGAPHQCSRVNKTRSGWGGEFATYPGSMQTILWYSSSPKSPIFAAFASHGFQTTQSL